MLAPVLRALTHHLRLQMRAAIAAVFPDYREIDKVLRVLLHTPGRYIYGETADWVVLARPQMPRCAAAMTALLESLPTPPMPTLPVAPTIRSASPWKLTPAFAPLSQRPGGLS